MDQEELEDIILEEITGGAGYVFDALRLQIGLISERRRVFSGKGFVSRFALRDEAKPISEKESFSIGDVNGHTSALEFGFGSLLFVDLGYIARLEIYTYGEAWPDCIPDLTLSYDNSDARRTIADMH